MMAQEQEYWIQLLLILALQLISPSDTGHIYLPGHETQRITANHLHLVTSDQLCFLSIALSLG